MKRKKVLFILAAIAVVVLAAADLFFILAVNNLIAYDKKEKIRNNGFHYISIQHESSPLEQELEDFQEVYDFLTGSGDTYYERYAQPLRVEEGEFFDYGGSGLTGTQNGKTEGGIEAKALQVSQNVLEDYHIDTEEGRSLKGEDFVYDSGKKIPVLMGNAYRGIYQIGDTFLAEYLFERYEFEVTGILQEGAATDWGIGMYWLDEYIVMPSFAVAKGVEASPGIKIHYANKTSGVLKLPAKEQVRFESYYRPVLERSRAGEYSWAVSPVSAGCLSLVGVDIYLIRNIAVFVFIVLAAGEIVILNQIRKRQGLTGEI